MSNNDEGLRGIAGVAPEGPQPAGSQQQILSPAGRISTDHSHRRLPRRRRLYEDWQGNEHFFCGGRIIAGPNWKSLLGTTALIAPVVVVYVIFVGQVLEREISIALPAVGLCLGVAALLFLFRTGCMDPGILPRHDPDEDYRAGRKPKSKEVVVNGHRVMVRYNETCHFYQPPRAHHCSVNDNCVEKFDHHCPWVGTTIGLRNYRWFLLFIFTASTLCLYVCATGVLAIKLEFDDLKDDAKAEERSKPSVWEAFEEAPAAVALAGYAGLFFLFVGGLSFFHIYLVSTNQTTYENFRYGYDRSRNPYDKGCLGNWASVWCVPTPKSRIDFRAWVETCSGVQSPSEARSGPPSRENSLQPQRRRREQGGGGSRMEEGASAAANADVELGPIEIRHNPDGGGKLQIILEAPSKERLTGYSSPTSSAGSKSIKKENSPAEIRIQMSGHPGPAGSQQGT